MKGISAAICVALLFAPPTLQAQAATPEQKSSPPVGEQKSPAPLGQQKSPSPLGGGRKEGEVKKAPAKKPAPKKPTPKKPAPPKKPVANPAPKKPAPPAAPNVTVYKSSQNMPPTLRDKDGNLIPTNPDAYDVSSATGKKK